MSADFCGAKIAILARGHILTILRDDFPILPWPGRWDLPGGGREGHESPEACVLRELRDELGLVWPPEVLRYGRAHTSEERVEWFFVAECSGFDAGDVVFGNEGQCWRMAPMNWYLDAARAIPKHQTRLREYLARFASG